MNWLYFGSALMLGVVLTTQVATNKQLGDHLNNSYIPAVANMVIGLIASLVATIAVTREWPATEVLKTAPWYGWISGGVLGVIYLTGSILVAPKIGAGPLIGLVVAGQIIFSVMIDNFGWFGFAQHSASMPRLLGCLLLICGVALVSKF